VSSQSIFTEGVIASLRQRLGSEAVLVVDVHEADPLKQLQALGPASIVIDASDVIVAGQCPLDGLLDALPGVTVVRLDPHKDEIQVVVSERRPACQLNRLVEVLSGVVQRQGGG